MKMPRKFWWLILSSNKSKYVNMSKVSFAVLPIFSRISELQKKQSSKTEYKYFSASNESLKP